MICVCVNVVFVCMRYIFVSVCVLILNDDLWSDDVCVCVVKCLCVC